MAKSRRYTVPECAGCVRARAAGGGTICAGYKEPGYFWAKYGSCPGYAATADAGAAEKQTPARGRAAAGPGRGRKPSRAKQPGPAEEAAAAGKGARA